MSLNLSIRDYRGVERADIELSPLALLAGQNEQGKSCLAQAARAALTGSAIPLPGIKKKDAKLLVRDGADKGAVTVDNGQASITVRWPQATVTGNNSAPLATDFAAGLRHIFDLSSAERANILAGYIDSQPSVTDLAGAMRDAGYSDKAIDQTWSAVRAPGGWDDTWKKARDHGTGLKGRWEQVTGEKYGVKKAVGWTPEGWSDELAKASVEDLEKKIQEAEGELERTIGARAVASANLDDLRSQAELVPEYEQQEKDSADEKTRLYDAYQKLLGKGAPQVPHRSLTCPKCEAALCIDAGSLVEAENAPTDDEIAEAVKKADAYEKAVSDAKSKHQVAFDAHKAIHDQLRDARQAESKLKELEAKAEGTATDEDVQAARDRLAAAQKAVADRNAVDTASSLHQQIEKNVHLVEILAPEGLRRRKLAAGLEEFNTALDALCHAAKWPTVRLDEDLEPHYGTRPVWAASASGQWRARLVVQVAMAQMDSSAAVVIDEADILDSRGRNALITLLKAAEVPALICMTVNKQELVPDLAKAGLGASYWIEAGVAELIHEQEGRAA